MRRVGEDGSLASRRRVKRFFHIACKRGFRYMLNVIGVRFKSAGKTYYFDPRGLNISCGDHVIVETSRGMEYRNSAVPKAREGRYTSCDGG